MDNKVRITIVGLGGVGGFYGGLLAHKYEQSNDVEICFVARGEHLKQIKAKGITVISGDDTIVGKPHLATDNFTEIGHTDYLIMATKGYDLEDTLEKMKVCVSKNTVILPLLNGVEAYEKLHNYFDEATVWEGCTYIVSRLKEAGVIENPSGRQKVLFGIDNNITDAMTQLQTIMKEAGIKAITSDKISTEIWEKYILVSASATATSYYNCPIGVIMKDHREEVVALLTEAEQIAIGKGVHLEDNIVNVIEDRLCAIPYESTTSMHSDFLAGKEHNELNIMSGYMVEQGKELRLETPVYTKMFESLQMRKGKNYLK